MTSIEVLAQREAQAEARKGKADMAWRKAWWATTHALGATEKSKIGAAQRLVREATGQSLGYVQDRTRTGRTFTLDVQGETLLPPGMATEVVKSKIEVTPAVVKQIVKAEKNGVSVREFLATNGGRLYTDTPAGATPAVIKQIVAAQPEAVAKAIVETDGGVQAVHDAVAETPIGRSVRKGIKRAASEHEARTSGPKHLRLGLGLTGELLEHAGWLDTIIEEYTPDEGGAEAARLIVQVFRYRCDMLEAWAGGNFEPMTQDEFDREMAALMGSES